MRNRYDYEIKQFHIIASTQKEHLPSQNDMHTQKEDERVLTVN